MSTLSQFLGGSGSTQLPFGIKPTAFYVDALVVGAGGGPADNPSSPSPSGAGGGRVVQVFNLLIEKNVLYTITVGLCPASFSFNGGDSAFGSIIAQGGGAVTQPGGSGGGGLPYFGGIGPTSGTPPGNAVFPTVGTYIINDVLNSSNIISSGNNGGVSGGTFGGRGGGGGAGSIGGNGGPSGGAFGGNGGNGLISTIKGPGGTGGPYYYGAGRGGTGGGGIFGPDGSTGFGSGGPGTGTGGQNGSVIIAYPNTFNLATTTGAPNVFTGATATRVGYHVYEFLGSGTILFN